jgi:hypothetical protein
VYWEEIIIKDEMNTASDLGGYVEDMSVQQQENADSSLLAEFVKVEMTFNDMSEYAAEVNGDGNATVTKHVKVELNVDDEYNSGSEETLTASVV